MANVSPLRELTVKLTYEFTKRCVRKALSLQAFTSRIVGWRLRRRLSANVGR